MTHEIHFDHPHFRLDCSRNSLLAYRNSIHDDPTPSSYVFRLSLVNSKNSQVTPHLLDTLINTHHHHLPLLTVVTINPYFLIPISGYQRIGLGSILLISCRSRSCCWTCCCQWVVLLFARCPHIDFARIGSLSCFGHPFLRCCVALGLRTAGGCWYQASCAWRECRGRTKCWRWRASSPTSKNRFAQPLHVLQLDR